MNECLINLAHVSISPHIRITGMRTAVSQLQVSLKEEGSMVLMATDDDGSKEGPG